ncbi:hypothetical protein CQW23_23013 [Capsicum baccatum]|uniref:NB-ARC domain-containing protein n=1 Tax=Capsicum baccatum TaxID=33114 RepID=A0A2G2W2I2_CAPBA|nr:hypothetical protein CQW23_23013 [Capsicum baccatum]
MTFTGRYRKLAGMLRQRLMTKRYLIVLDDMWDGIAWDELRLSFPDVGNKNRIIITTRLEEVVKKVKYHTDPYSLPFLTLNESCKLLQKKVFHQEGCPLELQVVSEAVARKCKGLPLVVVLVAGIIKKNKMEASWWHEVKSFLLSNIGKSEEYSLATMHLSYDNLPDYLRPCLLYMGMFPEDAIIPVSKLISLWIAEGFVHNIESGRSMEEVAEGYLTELISSNVVMVSRRRYNNTVKYCQVHDVVLHFCLEKSKEEKFMLAVKGYFSHFQTLGWNETRLSFNFRNKLFHEVNSSKILQTLKRNPVNDEEIVGLETAAEKLIQYLTQEENKLNVIPIVGMGGQGKTTIARILYNNDRIVHHFDVRAWCIISQTYNWRELLQDILSQVTGSKDRGYKDHYLADMLRKSLMRKRYLIVLDDMWDEESCQLLQKKVFQQEVFPPELQVVSQAVAERCNGLPLLVVLVAGIIKRKKMEASWWHNVRNSLCYYLGKSEEYTHSIMQLSYVNLPCHLRPCLLYMGMFPKDVRIPVPALISSWICEGFVQRDKSGKSLEETAEGYLMELISSNVVMISTREDNDRVEYCQVHDIVLHFCLEKSREEKFMQSVKLQFRPSDGNKHQISLDWKANSAGITQRSFHQNLRSLIMNNAGEFANLDPFGLASKLRLLKVLDLSYIRVRDSSSATLEPLIHLKYLAVFTDKFYFHRESHLLHLETLIVKCLPNHTSLPGSFWRMEKLRHVEISKAGFDLRNNKLGIFEESSKLENLRILRGVVIQICDPDSMDVLLGNFEIMQSFVPT